MPSSHTQAWIVKRTAFRIVKIVSFGIFCVLIAFQFRNHEKTILEREVENSYNFTKSSLLFSNNGTNRFERVASNENTLDETTPVYSLTTYVPKLYLDGHGLSETNVPESLIPAKEQYMFTCKNIPLIKITSCLGKGITKRVYRGAYNGIDVVIKVAAIHVDEATCVGETNISEPEFMKQLCYGHPNKEILKEIFILDKLKHRNIANLLGYCIDGYLTVDGKSTKHFVIAVEEYGRRFFANNFKYVNWKEHLRHFQEMAELLQYMENSPLGHIVQTTFEIRHFMAKNGHLKMIDMDSIFAEDRECRLGGNCVHYLQCNITDNKCSYFDRVYQMESFYGVFARPLFDPTVYPKEIGNKIVQLSKRVHNASITPGQLVDELRNIDLDEYSLTV